MFYVADHELPVLFEEGKGGADIAEAVIDDINLVYSHMKQFDIYKRNSRKEYALYGEVIESQRYINFGRNSGRYFPDDLHAHFGPIVNMHGNDYIIITDELLGLYVEAERFVESNRKAFSDLKRFVSDLDESSSRKTVSADFVLRAVYPHNLPSNMLSSLKRKKGQEVENFLFGMRIRMPSKLSFRRIKSDDYQGISFIAETLIFTKGYKHAYEFGDIHELKLVYFNDAWQIVMPYIN
jgi:hypothetical protein